MEAVGIGCLWFARKRAAVKNDPKNYAPAKHLEDVKAALEGVDSVSNVNVIGDGDLVMYTREPTDDDDNEVDNLNLYPIYKNVAIFFDIFMPKRIQTEISTRLLSASLCQLRTLKSLSSIGRECRLCWFAISWTCLKTKYESIALPMR